MKKSQKKKSKVVRSPSLKKNDVIRQVNSIWNDVFYCIDANVYDDVVTDVEHLLREQVENNIRDVLYSVVIINRLTCFT
jgi:hypothetical protein